MAVKLGKTVSKQSVKTKLETAKHYLKNHASSLSLKAFEIWSQGMLHILDNIELVSRKSPIKIIPQIAELFKQRAPALDHEAIAT